MHSIFVFVSHALETKYLPTLKFPKQPAQSNYHLEQFTSLRDIITCTHLHTLSVINIPTLHGLRFRTSLTWASSLTSLTSLPSSAMSLSRCVQNLSMLASLSVRDLSMAFLTPVMLGLNVWQTKQRIMKSGKRNEISVHKTKQTNVRSGGGYKISVPFWLTICIFYASTSQRKLNRQSDFNNVTNFCWQSVTNLLSVLFFEEQYV